MEPLGALSGGAGGMADAVAGIIEQRMNQARLAETVRSDQARMAETMRANQAAETFRQNQLDETVKQRQATTAENVRYHDLMNKDRVSKEGAALNESMMPGTDFSPSSPMAPYLSSVPKMVQAPAPPTALAADPTEQGSVNLPGTIANAPSPNLGRLLTKTPTFKQADTTEKAAVAQERAATAQQSADDRASAAATMADLREKGITQAGELARERIEAAKAKADIFKPDVRTRDTLDSIDKGAMLTDKVIALMEQEYPELKTNPKDPKFNSTANKFSQSYQKAVYGLGFSSDDDVRKQIESLLKPVQIGQFMRTSRNKQTMELALEHVADQGQTIAAQYSRLKTLRDLSPEMYESTIRSSRPVDLSDPLKGTYFDPARTQGARPAPGAGPAAGGGGGGGGEWIDIGDGVKVRKKQK